MSFPTDSSIQRTIVIKPGESFTLPPGATVNTVIGTLNSSNCSLPEPTELQCYILTWEFGNSLLDDATFDQIILGDGTIISISPASGLGGVDSEAYLYMSISSMNSPLIKAKCSSVTHGFFGTFLWTIKLEMPKNSNLPKIRLQNPALSGPGMTSVIYMEFKEDLDCETC